MASSQSAASLASPPPADLITLAKFGVGVGLPTGILALAVVAVLALRIRRAHGSGDPGSPCGGRYLDKEDLLAKARMAEADGTEVGPELLLVPEIRRGIYCDS